MACELDKYVGREVALEFYIGCGDTLPQEADWKPVGALRTKEVNLEWDTTDATADDNPGSVRSNLATYKAFTISGDGVSKRSDGTLSNQTALYKHVFNPTTTGNQPVVWMRVTFPDVTFVSYMLVTTMDRSAPYDDITTFSFEASMTEASALPEGVQLTDTPVV